MLQSLHNLLFTQYIHELHYWRAISLASYQEAKILHEIRKFNIMLFTQ